VVIGTDCIGCYTFNHYYQYAYITTETKPIDGIGYTGGFFCFNSTVYYAYN
jgi:hypothetical protein